MENDNKCLFWKYCFNREWYSKKAHEAQEIRTNSTRLAVDSSES